MWRIWKLAKAYSARPSELLGVTGDGLAAYHLDAAVWTFGSELDQALEEAVQPEKHGRKTKPLTPAQQRHRITEVLEKWLGIQGLKKYRDPAAGMRKR